MPFSFPTLSLAPLRPGVSGKNLEKLVTWFASPDNKDLINRLAEVNIACVEGRHSTAASGPPGGSAPREPASSTQMGDATKKGGDAPDAMLPSPARSDILKGERVVLTGKRFGCSVTAPFPVISVLWFHDTSF
jgi:NAD-dependent DNA ligase